MAPHDDDYDRAERWDRRLTIASTVGVVLMYAAVLAVCVLMLAASGCVVRVKHEWRPIRCTRTLVGFECEQVDK